MRVFAMPPRKDALPLEIVQGFLEALTSDDPKYATARLYLAGTTAHIWDPENSTTVLADGPAVRSDRTGGGRPDGDEASIMLTGSRVAQVDAQQSYTPDSGPYNKSVHLTRDKKTKQWRIDKLPQGVVMGKSDFQRNYMSVDKYYYASEAGAPSGRRPPSPIPSTCAGAWNP